ncbi:DUF4234 domain-containing protein [Archaeoglobus sp.]
MVKRRNIVKIYVLGIVTLGIYFLYWFWKSKQDINELGGNVPPAWMLLIPIANIYWLYKYAEAFSKYVKKDNNAVLWFLLFWFVTIIAPAIVQSELNKIAESQKME